MECVKLCVQITLTLIINFKNAPVKFIAIVFVT